MSQAELERAAALVCDAEYSIALTGAGMSTPSGIPDFRSPESGLWATFDPMTVASLAGFRQAPERFFAWMRSLAPAFLHATPNAAHVALAQLESLGKLQSIITQNIDMLHQQAGSQNVYEVHGHLREATCISCFKRFDLPPLMQAFVDDPAQSAIRCACNDPRAPSILKPNVILFGEQLPARVLESAQRATRRCDLMLVAGSSLEVYPVADFPRKALAHGARLILVNYHPTSYDKMADVVIQGNVAEVLPRLVDLVRTRLAK
ncbi:MAG: SIR2 family NAD-dependent protein deacylase [Anaerolineales bacterium]